MKNNAIYCILMAGALLTACSDELLDINGNDGEQSGLLFAMTTEEMGKEVVLTGTRAALSDGTPDDGDRFTERTLQGDNSFGLKVQKQPVPLMGFNRGAVSTTESQTAEQGTRAGANEVVTGITNFHDSLTIWGYTDQESPKVTLFNQILLTKVRNWRNSVEWPYGQGSYMRFYAVAPSLESINMSATGGSYATPPTLTYTLPEEADELVDVLYGESNNISIASGPAGSVTTNPQQENLGKDNKIIDLQFRHILTAVRFSQGTIPNVVTINSISISGSKTEGTYNPATTDDATVTQGKWTPGTATRTYTVSASHVGGSAVHITGTPTLFLLPQTLPSGATLTVNLTERLEDSSTKLHTLTCSLEGDVWKKGYTVDYKITVGRMESGYYLSTSPEDVELEHSASAVSSTLAVNSYRLYYDYSSGKKVASYTPVTWDIAGYSETDAADSYVAIKPSSLSWLTDFRGVLNADTHYNGGNNATASFTVAGQTMALSSTHDVVLSGNPTTGDTQVDLSTTYPYANGETHSKEPANCYIINRVGTYKFPLVYGNMTADNNDQKPCFKDHRGTTITKYQIKEQISANTNVSTSHSNGQYVWSRSGYSDKGIESTLRAVLLWQDRKGFISSVVLNESQGDEGVIQFQVGTSVPANAVIALQARKVETYASGEYSSWTSSSVHTYGEWETLWTWHIWMTDEVYRNQGVEDETSYDAYYINGSKDKTKADHIAEVQDYDTPESTHKILPVNLGWVPDDDDFGLYKPRKVYIKLKQTDKENYTTIKITQNARQELYTGTGTVYQWGRPTALPATRTITGAKRKIYDIDGNDITERFEIALASSPGDAISKPFNGLRLEGNANSWFDSSDADYASYAMWNSDSKTVYDPCPPGFRVPPASIFYGFSKKTGNTGSAKTIVSGSGDEAGKMNMYQDVDDLNGMTQRNGAQSKGGYFYLKADETRRYGVDDGVVGGVVYMPATGEFMANKAVGDKIGATDRQANQTYGLYWTSDYSSGNSLGCGLWITPDYSATGGTTNKPVLGFFDEAGHKSTNNYYNALRAIRPMKQ